MNCTCRDGSSRGDRLGGNLDLGKDGRHGPKRREERHIGGYKLVRWRWWLRGEYVGLEEGDGMAQAADLLRRVDVAKSNMSVGKT